MRSVFEKQIVRRTNRLIRVRKLMCLLSIFRVFAFPTVCCSAIKGNTELIRDLDPEAAQQLLDTALQHMMDAVHRFEGTVNDVAGESCWRRTDINTNRSRSRWHCT
jgi:hypothetical protein